MGLYALFVNGNRLARAAYGLICIGLAPSMFGYMMAASAEQHIAEVTYRLGLAPLLLAAAGIVLLESALARKAMAYRWVSIAA
ncbi:MAG: hypothetical protein AAGC55_16665, partial [Myxococcota bacterium]